MSRENRSQIVGYWAQRTREEAREDGFPWIYREVRLPRIDDNLLDCAIYLYRSSEAADKGERAGGSGFLLGVPLGAEEPLNVPTLFGPKISMGSWETPHIYAVTNAHVINDGFRVIRLNTLEGATKILAPNVREWIRHRESDLAICPIRLERTIHRFILVPFTMILKEYIEKELLNVGIGDDIVTIGRFVNQEGEQRNAPVARFGNIAAMPREPIPGPEGLKPQVSILAEVRTLPGYSGSPVFLRVPHWELLYGGDPLRLELSKSRRDDIRESLPAPVLMLLGITWGYIYGRNLPIKVGKKKLDGWKVEEVNTGMMAMVPAWKLLELLNDKKMAKLREIEAEEWENETVAGCP